MKHFVTLLLFLVSLCSFGQKRKKGRDTSKLIFQPKRIEFLLTDKSNSFTPIFLQKKGILIVEQTNEPVIVENKRSKGFSLWKLHLLDTALQLTWQYALAVQAEGKMIGYDINQENCYLLFDKKNTPSEKLHAIQLNLKDKSYKSFDFTTVLPLSISIFETVKNTLILGGKSFNKRTVLMTININDKIPRIIPGFYNETQFSSIQIDDRLGIFSITFSSFQRRRPILHIKTFTADGMLVLEHTVRPKEDKSILEGTITNFKGIHQYLAGSYSHRKSILSQGFYLSKLKKGEPIINRFYPFATLKNFFSYHGVKKESRIKKRIQKKQEKGKIKQFNYRILVHEIIPVGDNYTLVAEAYYPKYEYIDNNLSSFSMRPRQFSQPIFVGYAYTHAIVVHFDKNCNIIWDNTFKIQDKIDKNLVKNIVVNHFEDKITLAYIENNEIRSKIISGNEVIEDRAFTPIKLSWNREKNKYLSAGFDLLERWYDNYLVAFGEQNIAQPNNPLIKERKVFYLNKIHFNTKLEVRR